MSLSTDTALHVLAESAMPLADARQMDRLRHVQDLLQDDLVWVERAIEQAVGEGTQPAANAARHLVSNGGKRVRPMATLLAAACFGEVQHSVRELAVVVELVHSSTLLHDDVIDEGTERRGVPTARLAWGNAVSVLAGDVLLVHSLKRVLVVAPELLLGLLDTLTALVSGEVMQLRGRTDVDVTEETYERILRDKTASLFRFASSSAARLAGGGPRQQAALGEFGERLGIAFQLIDDVIDYVGVESGKTLCADLREGKVTLPLVLAAQADPDLLQAIRKIHSGDDSLVRELRHRVVESGACDKVRFRAAQETRRAVEALAAIDESPARAVLTEVARQLTARSA